MGRVGLRLLCMRGRFEGKEKMVVLDLWRCAGDVVRLEGTEALCVNMHLLQVIAFWYLRKRDDPGTIPSCVQNVCKPWNPRPCL